VNIISIALARPTRRGRRWLMPHTGTRSHLPCVSASLADSATIRMSPPSASSSPPVRQWPCTTQTTGMGSSLNRSMVLLSKLATLPPSPPPPISSRSWPAQKLRPGAAQHDAADLRAVGFDMIDMRRERLEHVVVQRIELLRPVERQRAKAVFFVAQDEVIAHSHGFPSCGAPRNRECGSRCAR
jgi:hypothetical protein